MKQYAKVYGLTDIECGRSDNGDWERRSLIIETLTTNPQLVAIEFFGKKKVATLQGVQRGMFVEVVFSITSREYEGKWFTRCEGISVKAFKPTDTTPAAMLAEQEVI